MLTAAKFVTLNDQMNNSLISKFYFPMSFLFKTRFFLRNTNNTDRNGINKDTQTHTSTTQRKIALERVSMKISDILLFRTSPPIYQPSIFMGNI